MSIGVLVPTRGDRERFLANALNQLSEQTLQPDFVEVVDDKPLSDKPDVTWRYRIGLERLREKGCEAVICIEDDDWYHYAYIDRIMTAYQAAGCPDIFGIPNTIYYHLGYRKYTDLQHPGRSSMMSMVINPFAPLIFPDDNYSYLDYHLYTKNQHIRKATHKFPTPMCIGIKHGIGMVGGGAHKKDKVYKIADPDYEYLKKTIDKDSYLFYMEVAKDAIRSNNG